MFGLWALAKKNRCKAGASMKRHRSSISMLSACFRAMVGTNPTCRKPHHRLRPSPADASSCASFRAGSGTETYVDWERGYKWRAHVTWAEELGRERLARLLARRQFEVIAQTAITIESRTNLLFSFEKMALRDALRTGSGARDFARGLSELLYGSGTLDTRF